MRKRILFDIVLLVAVFCTPWWLLTFIAFIGAFLFVPYYEIVAFGVLVDLLYGASHLPLGGFTAVIVSVVVFFLGSFVKSAVR